MMVNPWLYDKLPYQALRDFVPVATLVTISRRCWSVHPSVPAKTVAELIALAKAKPGRLTYASAGVGNFSHLGHGAVLAGDRREDRARAVQGHRARPRWRCSAATCRSCFNNVQTAAAERAGRQADGRSRSAEPQRVPALPDVPTVAETVPGFNMAPWVGIIAPVKTPKEIVARLSQETLAVMRDPAGHQASERAAGDADGDGTGGVRGADQEGPRRWANVIKTAGIKAE